MHLRNRDQSKALFDRREEDALFNDEAAPETKLEAVCVQARRMSVELCAGV
jgi:hypothetical protein